jgi:SAM-dependent methyltransferase
MLFVILYITLFLCILFLVIMISMLWPPDSPWAPFWATKPATARVMCQLGKVNEKSLVYDLGCGTGTAICIAAKEYKATCVGVEIDPLRCVIAWINIHWRWKVAKKVTIIRKNFFHVSFTTADIFFIYLIPNALKRLTPKFLKEVKKGALFISYVYPMPGELFKGKLQLMKHDKENRIFVYKMVK